MFGMSRSKLTPAGKVLLASIVMMGAAAPIGARADDGLVDVRTLPQLEGAVPNQPERDQRYPDMNLSYKVPTAVPLTTTATRKLLAAAGWQEFAYPDPSGHPMSFKKGMQGLTLSFTQRLSRPDQSVVYYTSDRL